MSKTRVLITGATGFVGRHLAGLLDPLEFEVLGTSYPQAPQPLDTSLVYLDLREKKAIRDLAVEFEPDWVFHLAAVSNVRSSWENREEAMAVNITGTFHLMEALREAAPRARVLFISSSDVYGIRGPGATDGRSVPDAAGGAGGTSGEEVRPLVETDPVGAVNPYAFTKAAGELLMSFYRAAEKMDVIVARPFPHTGPGQSADFVCSDWARQIALIGRGETPAVIKVGNLDVRRDFSDVRDVVRAYILLLRKGRGGQVYNVCSGRAVALKEILGTLIKEAGLLKDLPLYVEVDKTKLRKTDIPVLAGSNDKLKLETGWVPVIPLEQTLIDLLAFWRNA